MNASFGAIEGNNHFFQKSAQQLFAIAIRGGRRGRVLIRMTRGGQSVPLSTIPESYEESMKTLLEARKHTDDVLVYDNTPDGKGHRLVARFIAGELVKMTHSSPDCLKRFFGRELRAQEKQRE
jgi:predicted ABC-type ATPase